MIRVYNSLTRQKEELPREKKIKLFVCGPTVYGDAHIGNARTYIFFDFFAKYLRSQGYDVFYLQNITDIDDKIIKNAMETGVAPAELAEKFTQSYFEDMKSLGVDGVTEYAPATKFIPEIIAQVERLIEKGFAYTIDGDGWYFDIAKDADYGKLSGRTALQAEDGVSRIDDAIGKRNKGDFCLWKFSKPGEPTWLSDSLGDGRPGWHIEDTAISEKFFGPQYDIHGGAIDLKFPHHEAEIAQQESASGKKPFVKIWIHTGFLTVNGEKMSKSLGNFITIKDFLIHHSAELLRWMTLSHHYRSPFDFSPDEIGMHEKGLNVIKEFLAKIETIIVKKSKQPNKNVSESLAQDDKDFLGNLADDANTQAALGNLFGTIARYQDGVWKLGMDDAIALKHHIHVSLKMLDFELKLPEVPPEIYEKAAERELSRGNKDFTQSDALRKEIDALGYVIEDTPHGPFVWPKT